MKKYLAILLWLLISAGLFGCMAENESYIIRKYTDDISFKLSGYTQEEAEEYIEDIPTEDGGLLRIWYLKDDSGRVCAKLLISNVSASLSEYNTEFDKSGRLVKEIDIEYSNPEIMDYREYDYKLFSSKVEINLTYINGATELNNSIKHKMRSKNNTVTAKAGYTVDADNVYLETVTVTECDENGDTYEYIYKDGKIADNKT